MPDVDCLFDEENERSTAKKPKDADLDLTVNVPSSEETSRNSATEDEEVEDALSLSNEKVGIEQLPHSNGVGGGIRTLATVMENLPLSQETFLAHQNNNNASSSNEDFSSEFFVNDSCTLDKTSLNFDDNADENNVDRLSSFIGHSRSAHSFGPGDYSDQPRRTHMRHNSYEVTTGIQKNSEHHPPPLLHNNLLGSAVDRTNSAVSSRTNETSSYSSSSFSVSSLSCSDDGAGTGGDSSKRSSLDRRSLASSISESTTSTSDNASGEWKIKQKLPHLTSLFPKVLFSRRSSSSTGGGGTEDGTSCGPASWQKLFRPSTTSTALANVASAGEVPSTTALILENRPSTLPPKSVEEEQKHRQLYEQMVECAKKKEQKDAKIKKKMQREQLRQEELLSAAVKEWTNEILPKWEETKSCKRTKELWGQGLPPCVRGKVWKLAIGNELNITEELFQICANRAKDRLQQFEEQEATSSGQCAFEEDEPSSPVDRECTVQLIHLDVSRTFPTLGIFQKGGPYYDLLLNVLGAYVCYRPDVGYVQGMSFLAAVLLLNLDASDAFIAFANLMNRPCQLAFFRLRHLEMQRYFRAYDLYFEECLPKLYNHFKVLEVHPNLYLIEWLYTLYAKSLPLEVTCRVWDSFLRDGEEFLFKTAVGILYHYEDILLRMDFDRCVQFLTHLPDSVRDKDLFRNIDRIKGGREHRRFAQFLSEVSNAACCSTSLSSATFDDLGGGSSNEQTPVVETNSVVVIPL